MTNDMRKLMEAVTICETAVIDSFKLTRHIEPDDEDDEYGNIPEEFVYEGAVFAGAIDTIVVDVYSRDAPLSRPSEYDVDLDLYLLGNSEVAVRKLYDMFENRHWTGHSGGDLLSKILGNQHPASDKVIITFQFGTHERYPHKYGFQMSTDT